MKDQPPGWRGGVDVLGKDRNPAAALDRVHDVEKIAQGTGEAVVLGDGDHVTLAQLIEQAVQLGPAAGRAVILSAKILSAPAAFKASSWPSGSGPLCLRGRIR